MSTDFAERYRRLMKVVAPERVAARESAVADLTEELTVDGACSMVALVRQAKGSLGEAARLLIDTPTESSHEAQYTGSNTAELRFLAEEIALQALETRVDRVVDYLSIALVTSDFCQQAKALRRPDLLKRAARYLERRQQDQHTVSTEQAQPKRQSQQSTAPAGADAALTMASLNPILRALRDELSDDSAATTSFFDTRLTRIEEQLAVMSLYITRLSPSEDRPYDDMGNDAALVAARDLSDATRIIPGLRGAHRYLTTMLGSVATTLVDIMNDAVALKEVHDNDFLTSEAAMLVTPGLWSLAARRDGASSWSNQLSRLLSIHLRPIAAIDFAVQLYLEHMILKVIARGY